MVWNVACALLCSAAMAQAPVEPAITRADDENAFRSWARLLEELDVMRLQDALGDEFVAGPVLIRNVSVVSVRDPSAEPGMSVLLDDGLIVAVGPDAEVEAPADARVIDGSGRYLAPGLTDMHVHVLTSSSQHILNLTHGVTSVRDMDGFDWMLRQRDQARNGDLFAPNLYVSGQILNAFPMAWYAEVVETPEAARAAVEAHARAGYDFIKVHNRMDPETLRAVFDAAGDFGMDVVGHVPHELTVAEAVEFGFRTAEHFKGYLIDSTLQPTDEDYVAATRDAEIWNTPTFYARVDLLRGEDAQTELNRPTASLASPIDRETWRRLAETPVDDLTRLRQAAGGHARAIFANLRTTDARFLAGTDSGGGYAFMVYGQALHDELRTFQDLGMSPHEAMLTATLEPARAMRAEDAFGAVEAGLRADVILLDSNPLEDVGALGDLDLVCVRGACMDRDDIEGVEERVLEIYARTQERLDAALILETDVETFADGIASLHATGFVIPDTVLESAALRFEALDRPDDAGRMRALKTDADFSFN